MSGRVIVAWSGGKDCARSLHEVREEGRCDVAGLLATVTRDYGRVSMHGVREELLDRQAAAAGLPLRKVYIGKGASNDEYEREMAEATRQCHEDGITGVVFGDVFLEDVRAYRENNLSQASMEALFPLWGRDTRALAREFVELGFKAIVTCVDSEALDGSFAGRELDEGFFADLPPSVDPCGENGEFHSFVYDGPVFAAPVACVRGEVVVRDSRFHFCDLLPA